MQLSPSPCRSASIFAIGVDRTRISCGCCWSHRGVGGERIGIMLMNRIQHFIKDVGFVTAQGNGSRDCDCQPFCHVYSLKRTDISVRECEALAHHASPRSVLCSPR